MIIEILSTTLAFEKRRLRSGIVPLAFSILKVNPNIARLPWLYDSMTFNALRMSLRRLQANRSTVAFAHKKITTKLYHNVSMYK